MNAEMSLESALLAGAGFRHAFFTRRGGVSTGPFESLNFSQSVGDSAENVAENLARAAAALGVGVSRVYFLSQVHGREVVVIDGHELRERVLERRGDAVISRSPDLACGVRSADCVPILIADRLSGAAGAIHAGWRGMVAGVIEAAVGEFRRVIAASGEIVAAIGPHISLGAFEVSDEVAAALQQACPERNVLDRSFGERPHVDLRGLARAQLERAGVPENQVDDVPGCSLGDPSRFFSFRRDGQWSGRHLAAIVPRQYP